MDRPNLLLQALASDPEKAEDGDSDAVRSAHADFMALLNHRLGGDAEAHRAALEQYEANPEEGRERLKEVLESTGAVDDFDLVIAAQRLMKLVDPEGGAAGTYAVPPRSLPGRTIGH